MQRRVCTSSGMGRAQSLSLNAVFPTCYESVWEVEVVCAGTGAAGTSTAVWAVRTYVSGTSPKLTRLWTAVSVTPAAHQLTSMGDLDHLITELVK